VSYLNLDIVRTFRKLLLLSVLFLGSLFSSTLVHANAAGLLAGGAQELEPLTLSVVEPLAKGPYELESGKYYEIKIICDGSGELALSGAEFFRNIWIDEIVINSSSMTKAKWKSVLLPFVPEPTRFVFQVQQASHNRPCSL